MAEIRGQPANLLSAFKRGLVVTKEIQVPAHYKLIPDGTDGTLPNAYYYTLLLF